MFEKLLAHTGHNVKVVTYGDGNPQNVFIECLDCCEVLYDADKENEYEENGDDELCDLKSTGGLCWKPPNARQVFV